MPKLSHKDFRLAQSMLLDLYAHVDMQSLPKAMISLLGRLVPSDVCTYNEIDSLGRQMRVVHDYPSKDVEKVLPCFMEYYHEHPILQHWSANGHLRVAKISDFLTQQQFQRLALYNEFYGFWKLRWQLDFQVSGCKGLAIVLGQLRTSRDFTERDRTLLNLIAPHFTQAFRNAQRFVEASVGSMPTTKGLNIFKQGLILVSGDGKMEWLSPQCEGWLRKYWGMRIPNRLPEPLRRWAVNQGQRLQNSIGVGAPLILEKENCRLSVRFALHPSNRFLLLLNEETIHSATQFAGAGLTAREGEVLRWLAEGKKNPEIALILGISPRTVHKHFERIFSKLHVENREAALVKYFEFLKNS
jgi:DNA-binding CsgD family transcriptional regulator